MQLSNEVVVLQREIEFLKETYAREANTSRMTIEFLRNKLRQQSKRPSTEPDITDKMRHKIHVKLSRGIFEKLSSDIIMSVCLLFLCVNDRVRFARTCHQSFRISGCKPPGSFWQRPFTWNHCVKLGNAITGESLQKFVEVVKTSSLYMSRCENLTNAHMYYLRQLPVRTLRLQHTFYNRGNRIDLGFLVGMAIRDLYFCYNEIADSDLVHLEGLPLQKLSLIYQHVLGQGFASVAKLVDLRELDLTRCNTTPSAATADNIISTNLQYLRALPLEVLYLNGLRISDHALSHFSHTVSLTRLSLRDCRYLTDESLRYIRTLNLTSLDLSQCRLLTGDGFGNLSLMPLLDLDLSEMPKLTDNGIRLLANLPLKDLVMAGCNLVTDDGIGHIQTLTKLSNLDISECVTLTDAVLIHLSKLSLLTLRMWNLNISDEAVSTLTHSQKRLVVLGRGRCI